MQKRNSIETWIFNVDSYNNQQVKEFVSCTRFPFDFIPAEISARSKNGWWSPFSSLWQHLKAIHRCIKSSTPKWMHHWILEDIKIPRDTDVRVCSKSRWGKCALHWWWITPNELTFIFHQWTWHVAHQIKDEWAKLNYWPIQPISLRRILISK